MDRHATSPAVKIHKKKTLKRECVHLLNATLRLKIHRLNIAMDFSYRENAEMSFSELKDPERLSLLISFPQKACFVQLEN